LKLCSFSIASPPACWLVALLFIEQGSMAGSLTNHSMCTPIPALFITTVGTTQKPSSNMHPLSKLKLQCSPD
jgi:hypothetical protein